MNNCGERLKWHYNRKSDFRPDAWYVSYPCGNDFCDQWYWYGTFHNRSSGYVKHAHLHAA